MATEKKARQQIKQKQQKSATPAVTQNGGPPQPPSKGKQGIRHLVECTCILPQYLKSDNPVFHKFIVFSVVDENDKVIPKFVQCNNCDLVHKVFDICKSEFIFGNENSKSVITKRDLEFSLPGRLVDLLKEYDADLPTWEQLKFIIEEEKWGSQVILSSEEIDGRHTGKLLTIADRDRFGITPYSEAVHYGTSD